MQKGSQALTGRLHYMCWCLQQIVALTDLESIGDSDVEIGCCAFQQLLCAQTIA